MKISSYKEEKKKEIMEKCFECYCEHGLRDTGIKELGRYCQMTSANLYSYFENVDDLIIQSTAYCMAKVEDDFMAVAPENPMDIFRFLGEIGQWTAEKHGKKYRLMYQVYTHPKYKEHGKAFFEGVNKRYTEYACQLSPKLGIPSDILLGFIFTFVRAAVHYALFEDEFYYNMQIEALKTSLYALWKEKTRRENEKREKNCENID